MPRLRTILLGLLMGCGSVLGETRTPVWFRSPHEGVQTVTQVRELRCAACHVNDLTLDLGPPPAPELRGVGYRFDPDWIEAFLNKPDLWNPETPMPNVLGDRDAPDRPQRVDALKHFLLSLPPAGPKAKTYRHPVSADRGEATFRRIGCVACHQNERWHGNRPLRAKWRPLELIAFLQDPLSIRPDGRMPDMMLTEHEAADLTAYLLQLDSNIADLKPAGKPPFDKDKAKRGLEHFQQVGCVNCHDLGIEPTLEGPPMSDLRRGKPCGFAEHDAFEIRGRDPRSTMLPPTQNLESYLLGFQCTACHARTGIDPKWMAPDARFTGDESLAEAGRKPPTLNQAGAKLHASWMKGLIGTDENRLRPYMHTRMPVFGKAVAEKIVPLLQELDSPKSETALAGSIEDGRKLVGVGGMNCTTCHNLGPWKSLGIRGINLAGMDKRLKPAWFKKYLLDPGAYRPGTLMPALWPNGESSNSHILAGDTDKQIAAIWSFLSNPEAQPDGYPPPKGEFEIEVGEEPVVLRTFMKETGPHALVIGLPGGVNLVFDTEKCQIRELWKGKFIDGYSTWFVRFVPPVEPLGTSHLVLNEGLLESGKAARYLGYELNGGSVRIRLLIEEKEVAFDLRTEEGRLRIETDGIQVEPRVEKPKVKVLDRNPLSVEVDW